MEVSLPSGDILPAGPGWHTIGQQRRDEEAAMAEAAVTQALELIEQLDTDELRRVQRVIEGRLSPREATAREAFHQALLASGLVKEIKARPAPPAGERRLAPIQGQPLSETILEERS
jgi:hypothetical protein